MSDARDPTRIEPTASEGALCAPEDDRLKAVHETFTKLFRTDDTEALDIVLAVRRSVYENDPPLWLGLVGPPSSLKTQILKSLERIGGARKDSDNKYIDDCIMVSSVTPQTFLSGRVDSENNRAANRNFSLLHRMKDRTTVVCKDFGTVLSMRAEARAEVMSQMREIYDGGISKPFGTGYDAAWSGKMGFLFGVTEAIDHSAPSDRMLGERFTLLRLRPSKRDEVADRAIDNAGHDKQKNDALHAVIQGFLESPRRSAASVTVDADTRKRIAALANLITLARSSPHRDSRTKDIDSVCQPEGPARMAHQLDVLARSVAAVRQHSTVMAEDYKAVSRVAYDCLTPLKRRVLEYVCARSDGVTVKQVAADCGLPWTTAKRALEDLCYVEGGLVSAPDADDAWRPSAECRRLVATLSEAVTTNIPNGVGGEEEACAT